MQVKLLCTLFLCFLYSSLFALEYCDISSTNLRSSANKVATDSVINCKNSENIALVYASKDNEEYYRYVANIIENIFIGESCKVIERNKNSLQSMLSELKFKSLGITKADDIVYGNWENAKLIGTISIEQDNNNMNFSFRINNLTDSSLIFSNEFYKCKIFNIDELLDEPNSGYNSNELPQPVNKGQNKYE
jgi:hypothetical protein